MLNVPHRPGALYGMIARFAALGLNLTKLESRPIAGTDFEFMFYFDLDASVYGRGRAGPSVRAGRGPGGVHLPGQLFGGLRCAAGLIGEKLGHSHSKTLHGLLADYRYDLIELAPEELGVVP